MSQHGVPHPQYEYFTYKCAHAHHPPAQDTVTGFLLAGVGDVDAKRRNNFMIVRGGKYTDPLISLSCSLSVSGEMLFPSPFAMGASARFG